MPESDVDGTLGGFDNYRVHTGWIPERFKDVADRTFSLVHIDVDLYEPTRDSLEFFYGRMNRSGLILLDDYGFQTCPGATQATNEFFDSRPEAVVLLATGQAFVIKQ